MYTFEFQKLTKKFAFCQPIPTAPFKPSACISPAVSAIVSGKNCDFRLNFTSLTDHDHFT